MSVKNSIILFLVLLMANEFDSRKYVTDNLDAGGTLAWARHVTGQDTDDLTVWDDFKSVAVIPGRSSKANGDTRLDDEIWVIVERTIDSNSYTFVEQFQPLDWGDDPDYCWFVDAAVTDGNSYALAEIPAIPAVPPAAERDEAYAFPGSTKVLFFDPNFETTTTESIPDNGSVASSATVDSTGIVCVGYAQTTGLSAIARWDTSMSQDEDFFTPDGGWSNSEYVGSLRFTDDDNFLYAITDKGVRSTLYKFNASTGAEVWSILSGGASDRGMDVDSSDNIYVIRGGFQSAGAIAYSGVDGSLLWFVNMGSYTGAPERSILYDEANDRFYMLGNFLNSADMLWYQILSAESDGGNKLTYQIAGNPQAVNILLLGSHIYVTTSTGDDGYNVRKLDLSLNFVAGGTASGGAIGIVEDWDGNIAVSHLDQGGTTCTINTFDTDLNLLDTIVNTPGEQPIYGPEFVKIPYLDDGTPEVPAVPGHDPNYFPVDVVEGMEVCVYADGRPIGLRTVVSDANGTLLVDVNDTYDVVIAGLNYYSIYETFPLIAYTEMRGMKAQITDMRMDFHETMGCNHGVSLTNTSTIQFSDDNFATAIDPYTGWKYVTFPRGITREPIIYCWEWEPIPLSIRGLYPKTIIYEE
jgi:hypothetical protein